TPIWTSSPYNVPHKGQSFQIMTDPDSGNMYMLGARDGSNSSLYSNQAFEDPKMLIFLNSTYVLTNSSSTLPHLDLTMTDYASAWIEYRRSVMYIRSGPLTGNPSTTYPTGI